MLRVGSKTYRPLCRYLGVRSGSQSLLLQRMIVDFAAEQSFEQSAKSLLLHHGISLSSSCIRKITYNHAFTISKNQYVRASQRKLPAQGSECVILEMDGSMIPIVECANKNKKQCSWKEFRLCAAQKQGQVQTHYGVSMDIEQAGYCWTNTALQAGRAMNTQLHVVADGAEWIHKQWQENFCKQGRYLVDFYHVCEYLAAAQPIAATHKRWLEVQKKRLKSNHPERVLLALMPYLEQDDVSNENAPVRAAYRYLYNRMDQLDYKGTIANELPIGSGIIESAHKHVLQKRLKIAGAWWNLQNAHAMAHLRVCRANRIEHKYWDNLAKAA